MATAWTKSTWKFTGTREKFTNCTKGQTFMGKKDHNVKILTKFNPYSSILTLQ